MKITIFVDQLNLGGAGRIASILTEGLNKRGYNLSLVTDTHKKIVYNIPSSIPIHPYPNISYSDSHSIYKKCNRFAKRLWYWRNIIKQERPDLIIAFLPTTFFEVKIASLGLGIPIIASDHTSMGRNLGRYINFLRHKFYKYADAVTILTKKDDQILDKRLPNKVVVYNPLTYSPIDTLRERRKNILCAGRVDQWDIKGFDRMISMWATLSPMHPDWTLEIAGPGSDKSIMYLTEIAQQHNVAHSVRFLGQIGQMDKLYQDSAIFALPSRVEGFPMVLLEAMSQGCACISFDMQNAIYEIISNNYDGIIVQDNNVKEFITQLDILISEDDKRNDIALNAIQSVRRFDKEIFTDNWEKLIHNIANE